MSTGPDCGLLWFRVVMLEFPSMKNSRPSHASATHKPLHFGVIPCSSGLDYAFHSEGNTLRSSWRRSLTHIFWHLWPVIWLTPGPLQLCSHLPWTKGANVRNKTFALTSSCSSCPVPRYKDAITTRLCAVLMRALEERKQKLFSKYRWIVCRF